MDLEPALNGVKPIFVRQKDLVDQRTTGKQIADALNTAINSEDEVTYMQCRKTYGGELLWRAYLRSEEARAKVVDAMAYVGNQLLPIYTDNPFTPNKITRPSVKITVKDLPSPIPDGDMIHALQELSMKPTSRVMKSAYRENDGSFSNILTGDRFLYIDKQQFLKLNVPNKINVNGFLCRVYHNAQIRQPCKACKATTHQAGDRRCPRYVEESDVCTFFGKYDHLSNMFPTHFIHENMSYTSVEQAYQSAKAKSCQRPDLAEKIMQTDNPFAAKQIAKDIHNTESWESSQENIKKMKSLLVAKFQADPQCKEALLETEDQRIDEANPNDLLFGTGLTKEQTKHTDAAVWPGKNVMGKLLEEVRADLTKIHMKQGGCKPKKRNITGEMEPRRTRAWYKSKEHMTQTQVTQFLARVRQEGRGTRHGTPTYDSDPGKELENFTNDLYIYTH